MTFEQALIAAVVALSGATVAIWRCYTAREDKIHEQHRTERDQWRAEFKRSRRDSVRLLYQLAEVEVPPDVEAD